MEKRKLLFISSELDPFNCISDISEQLSSLPNDLANCGLDVRILMPRFGTINEKRHRLHEVVRLSGINVMFNDEDFALTVKVASLPNSKNRLQIYFLHNDEFYKRKNNFHDDQNVFYDDNSERMVFFNRGVMETLKKFGWAPDYVFCCGWMTSLIPLYAKTLYSHDPMFADAKIISSIHSKYFEGKLEDSFIEKAKLNNAIDENLMTNFKENTFEALTKGAIQYSDRLVFTTNQFPELEEFAKINKKQIFNFESYEKNHLDLINFIVNSKSVASGS